MSCETPRQRGEGGYTLSESSQASFQNVHITLWKADPLAYHTIPYLPAYGSLSFPIEWSKQVLVDVPMFLQHDY